MKVISFDNKSYVEFELLEIDRDKRLPSIVVSVTVRQDGFSGCRSDVCIEWDKIMNFLEATKNITYKTSLTTCLVSMSPDEMDLYFEKNNAEKGTLKYKLSKGVYVGHVRQMLTLSGGFEFSLNYLDSLREFFCSLSMSLVKTGFSF